MKSPTTEELIHLSRTIRRTPTDDRRSRRVAALRESLRLSREAYQRNSDNPTGADWAAQVERYEARLAAA